MPGEVSELTYLPPSALRRGDDRALTARCTRAAPGTPLYTLQRRSTVLSMRNQNSTPWVHIVAIQADDVVFDQDSQSSWPVVSSQPHPAQHWRRLVAGGAGSGCRLNTPIGTWVRRSIQRSGGR